MTYHRSDGNLEAEGYGEYFSLFDWIKERNPVSKTLKIILIVAAVLLVVGCGIMLFRFLRAKNQIMDGPGMIREDTFDFSQKHLSRVYYYRGGGELGDSYSVELTMEEAEDGTPDVKVGYYNQPTHSDKARTKTVRLGSFVITGVQEIIDRYHMTEWTDLPKSEYVLLDAPTSRLTYGYSDGTVYHLDSGDEWPDGAYEAVQEILNYILTCAGIRKD